MCTSLVVREEFWDLQLDTRLRMLGVSSVTADTIKMWSNACRNLVYDMMDRMQEWLEIMASVGKVIFEGIEHGVRGMLDALRRLLEECDVCTMCGRVAPGSLYCNQYSCIRQEQYYKSYFKLVKPSYNIMGHDRRCQDV